MRYYGGKWRIAPSIVAAMPAHEVYVEPFGGAASVLLRKPRSACEVYNDVYADVMNVFRQLRDSGEALLRGLFLTPYSRDEYVAAYETTTDPIEAARRFVFRSTAGIGSDSSSRMNGFRTSLADLRHTTATSWQNLPETLQDVVLRLRGVIIENRPALKVMEQYDAVHTLHYVDPPYVGGTRKRKEKGYAHEMKHVDEHRELIDFLKGLKGRVMLSGYPCELYADLLKDWHCVALKGGRDQVNGATKEMLWMNFEPEGVLI